MIDVWRLTEFVECLDNIGSPIQDEKLHETRFKVRVTPAVEREWFDEFGHLVLSAA